MNEGEIRAHAERIIKEHNTEFEFGLVYEDWALEDAKEAEWRAIHDAMYAAQITITWPTS